MPTKTFPDWRCAFCGMQVLRDAGFDVHAILENSPGIADHEVIRIARELDRVIVTMDSDYGELIFLERVEPPLAIIFFRTRKREGYSYVN